MLIRKILFFFGIAMLIVLRGVVAQPVADFEVGEGQDSVCVNESVYFTNTSDISGCSGAVDYVWEFGDGEVSYEQNPGYNYNSSSDFTVTLTVTCDGFSDSETMVIFVLPTPVADFETVNYEGCVPYEHSCVNTTTQEGGGTISSYLWNFGDGTSSTVENPVHEYTQDGIFNIMLEVTNQNGCSSNYFQENAIMLSDTPVVSFFADPQSWCYSPVDMNFNSEVTVSGSLGYSVEWDFGDGSPVSTDENPVHEYASNGDYDVSLTVEDDYGCTAVVDSLDYVHVHPVVPDFTIYDSDYTAITDNVACIEERTYFICNNEGYDLFWDFDNSQTSEQSSVEIIFSTPGTHTITLTVDPGGACESDTSFDVMVEDPQPEFTIDEEFSCDPPHSVHFTSSTTVDVDEYHWIFGDGEDGYGSEIDHTYENEGHFYPSLEIESLHGCTGSYSGPDVLINSPSALFSIDTTEGCFPLEVTATYDSVTNPDDIVNFSWDFYSNIADPNAYPDPYNGETVENHVYNDTGFYVIELIVMDINGCRDTAEMELQVGKKHTPLFDSTLYPTEVCPWDSLDFISESEDPDYIDSYEWLFGDTAHWQWGTSNEQDQYDYTFNQDTGWVQVVHVVENNGCRDSLFVDSLFYVNGPVIYDISYIHDCDQGNEYLFEVNLVQADSWDWIIRDDANSIINQQLTTTDSAIIYEFPGTGDYWAIVNAINASTGCVYRDSIELSVIQPVASFNLNPAIVCANDEYTFEESGSDNAEEFYWDFGDGEYSGWMPDSETTHIYHTQGDVEVCLHVRDVNGCEDSLCKNLHIAGPDIDITSLYPLEGCAPYNLIIEGIIQADDNISLGIVHVENQNSGFSYADTIVENGTDSISFISDSTLTDSGTYEVIIEAHTAGGCVDSLVISAFVELISLDAGFIAESVNDQDRQVCVGDSIEFIPNFQDDEDYAYEWDFGDGSPGSDSLLAIHTYDSPGTYDVSLTISGNGCVETEEKVAYIEVQEAHADFTVLNASSSCPPLILSSGDVTVDDPEDPTSVYRWYAGYMNQQGNGYNAYEFAYQEAGEYYLRLVVETSFGCTAEHQELITVDGPRGDLYVNGVEVENGAFVDACLHDTLEFSIENGEEIDSIKWTFGDGAIDQGYTVSHTYNHMPSSGNFYRVDPDLYGSGCRDTFRNVKVVIHNVQAAFDLFDTETGLLADTFQCSPFMVDLKNTSIGDSLLYHWDVEGLGTHTALHWDSVLFVNNTQMDSVVDITLEVENTEVGCWDDIVRQVVIGYVPDPNATPDTIICEGDGFNLHAENGAQYVWYPGLYLSETEVADPYALPEEDITYYVTITSGSECTNKDTVNVTIQYPVVSALGSTQDTIIIGESVSNYVETDQPSVEIEWSPDTDISCVYCENPTFYPRENRTYMVVVTDSLGCFTEEYNYDIVVDVRYTLDVPKAFTPEGNAINRVVYVKGMGIKDLKEFSIYNRWGEKLFQTDDIEQGWDGYYKGKLQPVDTYVYYVEAEMWNGSIKTKKGTIMLIQ
ncbi:MAG: PKD domain-containing protein [Candidatus Delongbacteria bacterium]|jgi:gliding motility-associated-like protein|nr:PKD domain-containing protein [Candidatus Delongbacteria bacterium]